MKWWEAEGFFERDRTALGWGDVVPPFVREAMRTGDVVHTLYDGRNYNGPALQEIVSFMETQGLHYVLKMVSSGETEHYFVSEDAFVEIDLRLSGEVDDFYLVASKGAVFEAIRGYWEKNFALVEKQGVGQVYMLKHTRDGYDIAHLGTPGRTLIRENYTSAVLGGFDHVVADLKSVEPCGRLVILSGEPGCGKTWMVRGLLSEVPDVKFVMVPPSLIANLGEPDLLPDLKRHIDENRVPGEKSRALVFVVEDADQALLPRMGDNMTVMQSMLNATDGIIGSLLDVRIVATTNAEKFNMEKALMRHGRLCRHIEVGKLPPEQANQVLKRLLSLEKPDFVEFTRPSSVADVYHAAYELLR